MQPKGRHERIYVCAALIKDFREKNPRRVGNGHSNVTEKD